MKKKKNIKTIIRQIVREEVAMAIHEVITELKQPTQQKVSQPKSKNKIVEKKEFTKNSILNDVLNETAMDDEWKTMSGGTYTSNDMSNVLKNQYGNLMNGKQGVNPDEMIASMGANPNSVPDNVKNIFTKDYSKVLKAMDEKAKEKRPM
tara:strand:+ start:3257 stop:3703 length:447 start_codon:yes stop_codon:yes gene_type:complete